MRTEVLYDSDLLAQAAGDLVEETFSASSRPNVSIGLAGGSTPQAAYRLLAERPLDWERAVLWLSDERWVAHDHPDSNGATILQTLASHVPARFLRPRYSPHLNPSDSAAFYEAELRLLHGDDPPDLILLGMGADGHTASLFAGTAALETTSERIYVATNIPSLDVWRLTSTFPLLEQAERVVVLVSGAEKAETLAAVLKGPEDVYPIQRLLRLTTDVIFLVDQEAGSLL